MVRRNSQIFKSIKTSKILRVKIKTENYVFIENDSTFMNQTVLPGLLFPPPRPQTLLNRNPENNFG